MRVLQYVDWLASMKANKKPRTSYADIPQDTKDRHNQHRRELNGNLPVAARAKRNEQLHPTNSEVVSEPSPVATISTDEDAIKTFVAGVITKVSRSFVHCCATSIHEIGKGNTNGQPVPVRRRPVPTKPFVLPSVPQCVHCHAKRFPFEPDGFCCSKGQVSLYPLCTSDKLLNLYRDSSKLSKDFRTHIRPYNNMFAFTSFGVTLDPRYTKNHQGIYTFRAQGQIYHFLRTLYPADGKPSYLQLYFYDTAKEVEHRLDCLDDLDRATITQLIDILKPNPYSKFFRSLSTTPNIDSYQIRLRADPIVNDKTFSAPAASQVALIWKDTEDASELRERDILVQKHDGHSVTIKYYYGCYDLLQYPLLFPYGEPGWHRGIKRTNCYKRSTQTLSIPDESTTVEQLLNAESLFYLRVYGQDFANFGLDDLLVNEAHHDRMCKEISDEQDISVSEIDLLSVSKLNPDQLKAYNEILQAVRKNAGTSFFIDGPGGTGKTFLYRALLATIRSARSIALATATSGVAASILPNGRTAHSRFKIPLDRDGKLSCNSIEALDNLLKDITEIDSLFGSKVVVLGGDFRQVLLVIPKGTKEDCIDASLVRSHIWPCLKKFTLKENMRARTDPSFSSYLLRVGNGEEPCNSNDEITIPPSMVITPDQKTTAVEQLIDFVFLDLRRYSIDAISMTQSAILTPRNESVDQTNELLINRFPGKEYVFLSIDETVNQADQGLYVDFMHSVCPPGLPSHRLVLKENCPVMMSRNLDPSKGLCNGTRLIRRKLHKHVIMAQIAVGEHQGDIVFIPRISLQPSNAKLYPVQFTRRQFPIRLSFAMTINKAQGQTLDIVGVNLQQPVFSHGQLYVALSRATTASKIKVILDTSSNEKKIVTSTKNIVYNEILSEAHSNPTEVDLELSGVIEHEGEIMATLEGPFSTVQGARLKVNNYQGFQQATRDSTTFSFNPPSPAAEKLCACLKFNVELTDKTGSIVATVSPQVAEGMFSITAEYMRENIKQGELSAAIEKLCQGVEYVVRVKAYNYTKHRLPNCLYSIHEYDFPCKIK
ncbi:hypothetical protein RHGRI_027005 [Rhododendron griersonianum]|uniref:ATP-dependent DNA helicase n=1 Tax=Rhododendron griersonianum TaxID=479676 RepID=A0AAV6J1C8_9ERIC|nr:hypothetical protein RHGRI_027005 [Rhododendron griersonianum]